MSDRNKPIEEKGGFMKRVGMVLMAVFGIAVLCQPQMSVAKEVIPIYTPGSGGTAYFLGGAIAKVLNKHVPEVQMMVEGTGGSSATIKYIDEKQAKGQAAFGISDSKLLYLAYAGQPPFEKAFKGLRAITFLYGAGMNLVVLKNSPIKTMADLKGKKVALGAAGSGTSQLALDLITAHGVTKDMYKQLWLGYKEVVEGLQDESIDAGFISGAYPIPAMKELSIRKEIRVIPANEEVLKKILPENPYLYQDTLKPGSYSGVDQPTPILVFGVPLETHVGVSDDLVYKMTKALFENRKELIEIHPVANEMNPQSVKRTIAFPFHNGAEKYFKEAGIFK
ncbi:MAG: TAXI family TRAP transporter solute-binding subunit [Desulfobacteraceae bacterium]|nr:MAG: TAXI family TRAP transporter solute-binding subunit [Desulfobacteraceae bacterium]